MSNPNTDPRMRRTRKLIMDSFITLSNKKEFKDITVTDITNEATINRATFYYHFEDKFDLLEQALEEGLITNITFDLSDYEEINEDMIISTFIAITNFWDSLAHRCQSGYEDTISRIIIDKLTNIFYPILLKQHSISESSALKNTAIMLSWGMYGVSVEWRTNSQQSRKAFIQPIIPYILHGVNKKQ
ncbi:TetR/AcrR family transcriptional regulator [Virgibacillus dokdonensis]|uniref:TetR/AcrR family transcriptional regulator n=1 Tax=Virgibacillus dokdonensis TaxID=302167 RepID=A0ABU7VFX6_9BACI|nr:TetR/AcrR family transcriptional regulator [Virgibacillus dokdonensis]